MPKKCHVSFEWPLTHLAALQDCVDQVVGILPGAPVFGVDEEDEVAEAEIAEQHPDSLHRFPENRKRANIYKQNLNVITLELD